MVGSQTDIPSPVVTEEKNTEVKRSDAEESSSPHTIVEVTPEEQRRIAAEDSQDTLFLEVLRKRVQEHMTNSDFGVESLANEMGLSRVQLYRKVKAITGSSPVELLRTARLNRGYQLLLTTDKTASEVAYAVGFSAPAYFTKCFKDKFGIVPGEVRSKVSA